MKYERTKARLGAVEVLYRYDIVKEDPKKTLQEIIKRKKLQGAAKQFTENLVEKIIKNLKEIDDVLEEILLQNWTISRLSYIDRAILRVAIGEMLFFNDIPPKVSINEAIEVAKYFGTPASARFVNGVLDTFLKKKLNVH